jgi:hypothetical protein
VNRVTYPERLPEVSPDKCGYRKKWVMVSDDRYGPAERLKGISANGLEWSETNGLVSATQLRRAPLLGHLFAKPIRSCKPSFYELMV